MTKLTMTEEIVRFQRRAEFAGVEVLTVENSGQPFRSYSPDFEFLVPTTWRGEIWHRRQRVVLEPGSMLCAHPGEVFLGQRVLSPGSRTSLSIERHLLAEWLPGHPILQGHARFRRVSKPSTRLRDAFFGVVDAIRPGTPLGTIQGHLSELITRIFAELLEASSCVEPVPTSHRRAAERVRDCLQDDLSSTMDLATLAERTGMSRFRATRVFKSWYGLPPYTYQLRVRLGLAQKLLRQGHRPAEVAAEYGFVDQSHLTRHFRRFLGVTPAEYARIGRDARALVAGAPVYPNSLGPVEAF